MFLPRLIPAVSIIMANIDDFFAKKDKKKKGTKKFSKANTDVIAQNLEESARKEQLQQDKDINNLGDEEQKVAQQVADQSQDLQITLQHFLLVLLTLRHFVAFMDLKTVQTELKG